MRAIKPTSHQYHCDQINSTSTSLFIGFHW
ncbi:hypothetical protein ANCCAN_10692 [Ancylostoma caninum]|uniref:Uncharacterized protein n=1 Tax=Ancylostoma caninum TaxID=29170 RepID=A0A368GI11_ANCCA|nr:hypothetical protein ANCCAN_10692 [Ancylostoma caninum]